MKLLRKLYDDKFEKVEGEKDGLPEKYKLAILTQEKLGNLTTEIITNRL